MNRVTRIAGSLVLIVGLMVLVGWKFNLSPLKSVGPDFVSMKANTATAFFLAGLALITQRSRGKWTSSALTGLLPGVVALIGLLTLSEYVLGLNLRIDEILFLDRASIWTSSPGRMAPPAALGLLLMGTSILLTQRGTVAAARVAQAMTLLAMLFSFLVFVGYLYRAKALYGLAAHTFVAPHTVVASLVLGVGILASSPDVGLARLLSSQSAGGILLRRMLPLCVILPVLIGGVRLWGQRVGLYDTELGLALFATANVIVICALMVWVAGDLTTHHDQRVAAQAELRRAKEGLEVRVAARTKELANANVSLEQRNVELARAQELLHHSEAMYRTLTRSLPNCAILLFDHDLRYLLADGAKLLTALGLEKEQILGKTLFDVAATEQRPRLEALYRSALRGESDEMEATRGGHTLALHTAPVSGDDGAVTAGMVLVYDITALKQAQEAARLSEEQFRRLVEALPDMVAVIRDQHFVYVNPAAVRTLGYESAHEITGMSVLNFVPPPDRQTLADELAANVQGDRSDGTILRSGLRRDGSQFFAEYISLPMEFEGQPAIVSIAKDVTDRYRSEAAVREATALWRAILDGANYTMIATTAEGVIREFNVAAERMLGYAAAEVVGNFTPGIFHDLAEVVAQADVLSRELGERIEPGFDALVAKARRGSSDENEWTYIRKDGSRFPVRLSVTALRDSAGLITGFLGIGSDITEYKRAREELIRAKETAEQAMRARSDFLARMSHEIRTPMNGVLGMTALALDTSLNREQREYIQTARSSAEGLLSLINDILDFSKIDAGKLLLEHIPFRPRTCFRDSLRNLAGQAHAKGLELLIELAPDVPTGLIGDPQRLQQIVTNLVGNAVKFTDKGDVAVRVAVQDKTADGIWLLFEVIDTGIGIPHEKQAAIFDAFSQADEATTRRFGGTGLGLSICSQLVTLMGGKLWVKSELGRGSVFSFAVPMTVDPDARPDLAPHTSLKDLRVLLVDDHPIQRQIIQGLLSSWEMRPVAANQERAVELAREAQVRGEPFRLVILDSVMPGVDSYELGARIRDQCIDEPAFVLLGTGVGLGEPTAGSGLRVSGLVMKPVAASNLLETVQAVLTGAAAEMTMEDLAPTRPTRRSLQVLVAEDNAVNRRVARRVLERAGHKVTTVDNGRRALTALAQATFDVVLMDVQMPEMDGIEATRTLRASERNTGKHVPVIALTAQAMKGDRENCLAAGMDAYVSKPLDMYQLLAAIEEVTRGRSDLLAPDEFVSTPTMTEEAFDRHHMLSRIGGDLELMRELVTMFQAGLPQLLQALDDAVAAAEPLAIVRAAHTLRGALLNLSAKPAARLAQDIEELPHHEVADKAPERLLALRLELDRLDEVLRYDEVVTAPGSSPASDPGTRPERGSS